MKWQITGGGKNDPSSEVLSLVPRGYRKILVKESLNEEFIGLNLLKKGFHLSCFPMNFANLFRQAVLQHTSERPHLEDSLALSETAEPK